MIAHDTVGQQRDGMRVIAEKHARSLHTDTTTTVRMI